MNAAGRYVLRAVNELRGTPPVVPDTSTGLLEYWDRRFTGDTRGGTERLTAALGAPRVTKAADPEGYRRYRTISRRIQRWRNAALGSDREARRLKGDELAAVKRATRADLAARSPRQSVAAVMDDLRRGFSMHYAGYVRISEDEAYKDYPASIDGDDIDAFAEACEAGDWDEAADELADLWRRNLTIGATRGGIPAYCVFTEPDTLTTRRSRR